MSAVRHWVGGFIIVAGTATVAPRVMAQQEGATPDSVPLAARVDELEQQILVLKRLRELEADSIAAAAKDKSTVTASGKDGFSIKSADGKYVLKLRGYAQADGRFFGGDDSKAVPNTLFLRRARPILEATVGKYFGFRIMPDFAQGQTVLFDAYGDVNLTPAFAVRLGKFKPPVGLERLQSATDVVFAERGLPTNLVPNRDIGFQLGGDIHGGVLSYAVGVFNGVPDLGNGDGDLNDSKDLDARVFLQPITKGSLKGLGIGIAGTTGTEQGGLSGTTLSSGLPAYRSPGQQTVFRYRTDVAVPLNSVLANGRRSRLVPQGYFYSGPFGIQSEYAVSRQEVRLGPSAAELTHTAWQASGSFFLTGEKAGFRSPTPKKVFDPSQKGFGALELVARYGELDVDDDAFPTFASPTSAITKEKSAGVGLNWYLNKQIKVAVNYEHTAFDGGAADGDRKAEDFFVTRFQHSF
jgi:phosphate-selective porin OprO/OprP